MKLKLCKCMNSIIVYSFNLIVKKLKKKKETLKRSHIWMFKSHKKFKCELKNKEKKKKGVM